jgi:hypothetical protein
MPNTIRRSAHAGYIGMRRCIVFAVGQVSWEGKTDEFYEGSSSTEDTEKGASNAMFFGTRPCVEDIDNT